MPTYQELIAGFTKSPLPTMLAITVLVCFGLWGRIWTQDEAKDRAKAETNSVLKQCAEDRLAMERRYAAEKDSIYRVSLSMTKSALEKMGELKQEIKRLKR